jgi:hypothetical protein
MYSIIYSWIHLIAVDYLIINELSCIFIILLWPNFKINICHDNRHPLILHVEPLLRRTNEKVASFGKIFPNILLFTYSGFYIGIRYLIPACINVLSKRDIHKRLQIIQTASTAPVWICNIVVTIIIVLNLVKWNGSIESCDIDFSECLEVSLCFVGLDNVIRVGKHLLEVVNNQPE